MSKIKVGIVGGTGYTGVELLRLLISHPQVTIEAITSRSQAGTAVADLFPNLRGHIDLNFSQPDADILAQCDVLFFATPNGTAMQLAPALLAAGVKIIDLAADFRLKDPQVWQHWYGIEHSCPNLLAQAVYGLPEINRAHIKKAQLVANPGCYPTAVLVGFIPLLEQGWITQPQQLIADAKSGVTGAGRKAAVHTLLGEASENFKAYAVNGHRHLPEIKQGLNWVSNSAVDLTFVPHLTPMIRGIHATLYAQTDHSAKEIHALFVQRYQNEPFIDVLPANVNAETRSVRGSNVCRLTVHKPQNASVLVICAVIDNLVKGAAGQAVQNMNILFDLEETSGLQHLALLP